MLSWSYYDIKYEQWDDIYHRKYFFTSYDICMEEIQHIQNAQISSLENKIKEVANKKRKSATKISEFKKEKEILRAKLKEIKQKQKEEIKRLKNRIRDDIRKAEAYMAFLELRFLESLSDEQQENVATMLYQYILELHNKNGVELERAKKHIHVLKLSNKRIYEILYSLLNK